jgi:hypothetical protein
MTAATAASAWSQPAIRAGRVPVQPVTLRTSMRSEWIKLTTLRSTWLTLALAVLGTIIVGAVVCANAAADWGQVHHGHLEVVNPIDASLTGILLAQLAIGVLGVLTISGEYATGMIRSSLAAAPRRLPVLAAKLAVYAAMTAVMMTVATLAAFVLGQAFLGSHGTTLTATHALRAVLGGSLYLVAVGVLGVALGFLLRSTAGGIAALVGLLLVLPALGDALPVTWQPHLLPYLPSNAGAALYSANPDPTTSVSPLAATVVLAIWCAIALTGAATVLRRRDA